MKRKYKPIMVESASELCVAIEQETSRGWMLCAAPMVWGGSLLAIMEKIETEKEKCSWCGGEYERKY